jgi:hypothetical protein
VVEAVANVLPHCRMLVTSRTYAYQQQEWKLQGFAEAVLTPFSKGQIRRFVDHWYQHIAELRGLYPDDAQGRAELLKRAIFSSDRLYGLAERPLLLTLMASLHAWRGGSLPEKREELYNDTVELLVDWWERPKVVRDETGRMIITQPSLSEVLAVGKDCLRSTLGFLAFDAHQRQPELRGTADIAEQELVSQLMRVSQNKDLRPARLVEYLSDRAGLLVPRGVGVYTFPHRTFQEYLAACYLADQDFPDNVATFARQNPNRWREVALLAGAKAARGSAATIWMFVEALCYREMERKPTPGPSQEGNEDAWGALLAGQALVEIASLQQISPRNQPKVEHIRQWLVAILTEQAPSDSPFPATERALAGNLLAQLGDPRPGVGLRADGLPDIRWCEVPAGTFIMGSNEYSSEKPQHKVNVAAFHISRYPVTNAQYQAFVEDGGYTEKWRECWTKEGWEWKEENKIAGPEVWWGV